MDTEIKKNALTLSTKTNNQTHDTITNNNIQNNPIDVSYFINENNKLNQLPSENKHFQEMNSIASYIQPQITSDMYANTYQCPLYAINNMPQQSNFSIHQIHKSYFNYIKI